MILSYLIYGIITLIITLMSVSTNFYDLHEETWESTFQKILRIGIDNIIDNLRSLLQMKFLELQVGPLHYLLLIFIFIYKAINRNVKS